MFDMLACRWNVFVWMKFDWTLSVNNDRCLKVCHQNNAYLRTCSNFTHIIILINVQLLYANIAQLIEIQTVNADCDIQLGTLARRRRPAQQQPANIDDIYQVGTVHQSPAVRSSKRHRLRAFLGFRFGFNIHKMLIQICMYLKSFHVIWISRNRLLLAKLAKSFQINMIHSFVHFYKHLRHYRVHYYSSGHFILLVISLSNQTIQFLYSWSTHGTIIMQFLY